MTLPAAENFAMTLTLGGRYAGQQDWAIHGERGTLTARVQTEFGGVLPEVRRVQTSRMHARTLSSLHYAEGDGGRASFETTFDHRAGVVTLRQGRDEAQTPLTVDHHDPVSLLVWLRTLEGQERAEARLTGGKALIQRLADVEVDGQSAYVYFLRPGGAYVYIEQAAPHRLLRLIQPTDFGPIEANLGASAPPRRQGGSKGRRRAG
ncbi:hypothetical protein ACINK0_00975 [Deinococcus sp. VB343]|uniref:DUF3108 domain-containing protein n=1 Tax=Deinococcus sp. VB142 TaxID=3112952 RepID=A0AAU6Q268_9DEIO